MSDTPQYGKYCLLIAVNQKCHGERTNLGVIVFNPDGTHWGSHVAEHSITRAIARGDLSEHYADMTAETLTERWCQNNCGPGPVPITAQDVEKSHASMGHAMSCIQFSDFGATLLDDKTMESLKRLYTGPVVEPHWILPDDIKVLAFEQATKLGISPGCASFEAIDPTRVWSVIRAALEKP